jgi:two-component system sensor histidine kinase UhpB
LAKNKRQNPHRFLKGATLSRRLRRQLLEQPLFKQIALGNSIIILIGAVGGTLVTRHLTDQAADLSLIVLFSAIGTTLTIALNYWLIRTALQPLHHLSRAVERVLSGDKYVPPQLSADAPADINQLAAGLNSLVLQLGEQNRQLKALSQRAINAHEEERKRISLSLHDDTGQSLTTLIINLERLERQLPPERSDLISLASTARQIAQATLAELRKIIYGLRPSMLDDLGLVPAIRWYARSSLEQAGIHLEFSAADEFNTLDPQSSITLFRIAQEAVNNIVKHSQAKSAWISLQRVQNQLSLQIRDDGIGFDPRRLSDEAAQLQRWGLVGIVERAELVGGKVNLDSTAGAGTCLEVIMPYQDVGEARDG